VEVLGGRQAEFRASSHSPHPPVSVARVRSAVRRAASTEVLRAAQGRSEFLSGTGEPKPRCARDAQAEWVRAERETRRRAADRKGARPGSASDGGLNERA
jgi:hypothetical protein